MDVTLNQQTSVSAAAREATGQIHLPAQAISEEPLQPLQAANIQTHDKYQAALKRLEQNEYNLVNLVKCLGDFDPIELVGNFVEPSDSINDCISPDYQDGTPNVEVKGNLKLNIAFWDHIGASIQSNGKKRLILDLHYPNYFVMKSKVKFEDVKNHPFLLLSIVPRTGFFHSITNLVIIIYTFSRQTKSF